MIAAHKRPRINYKLSNIEKSIKLFIEAKQLMPGGVNSPVRAFKNINGNPIFFEKAKGAYLYDADGNEYIEIGRVHAYIRTYVRTYIHT